MGPGRNCRNDRPRTRRAEEIASRHAECFMVHGAKNQRCNNLSE